jgi:hypothetical protein
VNRSPQNVPHPLGLRLAEVDRVPRTLHVAILAAWSALILATAWLAPTTTLCRLKAWTGVPCPLCGGTRATFALARGDVGEALTLNPLAIALLVTFAVILGLRILLGRAVHVEASPLVRRVLWSVALALVVANWAYVAATLP